MGLAGMNVIFKLASSYKVDACYFIPSITRL